MSNPNFVGTTIGQYRIVALLSSKGGMADVYKGVHINLGKEAAIKVIKVVIADPESIEDFKREAVLIAQLDMHPNIVHIEDAGLTFNSWPYIAMPLAAGDLKERIRGRKLALDEVLTYVIPIAQALYHVHQLKPAKVHRDVKPDNVLISKHGVVWLSDFGIAVDTTSGKQELRNFAGTYAYTAPEQFQLQPRTATDQYALAIIVYQMFCNALPFYGRFDLLTAFDGWKDLHLNNPVPSFQSNGTSPDPEVEAVLKRALAKKPEERYPTILDFANALEAIQSQRNRAGQIAQEQEQQRLLQELGDQLTQKKKENSKLKRALVNEQEEKNLLVEQVSSLKKEKGELEEKNSLLTKQVVILQKEKQELRQQIDARAYELFRRGVDFYDLKQYIEALDLFDQAIKLNPQCADAHYGRGLVLDALKRHLEAYDAVDQAIKLNSQYADVHYKPAILLIILKRTKEALEALDQAIKLNPEDSGNHFHRSVILISLNRDQEALNSIESAISLEPKNSDYQATRRVILKHLADSAKPQQAKNIIQELKEKDEEKARALHKKGFEHFRNKEYTEALEAYNQAIALVPQSYKNNGLYEDKSNALEAQGDVLSTLGRYQEALDLYEQADQVYEQFHLRKIYSLYLLPAKKQQMLKKLGNKKPAPDSSNS